MWSNKKYVNVLINILLFLMAMNFMHYGQLFLPIICIIIFIDNKFKIKVHNTKIFIILCLFAISFCIFSYKLGFYCVMGFCLPMAYYIGSNLEKKNEENIKNVIYIVSFGMAIHMILNFCLELAFWGDDLNNLFHKISHYDIWQYLNLMIKHHSSFPIEDFEIVKQGRIKTTLSAMNFVFIIGCCYYLIRYEKHKFKKWIGLSLFILCLIYSFALGRRTTILLLLVSSITILIFEAFRNSNIKYILQLILIAIIVLLLFVGLYFFNIFGFKDLINSISIFSRLIEKGLESDRFAIFIEFIKNAPTYLFGGQQLSNVIGLPVHDLLSDIYDYAGIVPFVLFLIYSIYTYICLFRKISNFNNSGLKILAMNVLIIATIQLFLEPIMTGASIYLICYVLICTAII